MEMDAKYKKYYDKLKGIDLQAKGKTTQTLCESNKNTLTSFSSSLSSAAWKGSSCGSKWWKKKRSMVCFTNR